MDADRHWVEIGRGMDAGKGDVKQSQNREQTKALRDVEKKVQEKKRLGDGADQSQLVVAPPLKRCALEIAVPVAKNEGDN